MKRLTILALIHEWGLLREWIRANHEALRRREHIRAHVRQWQEQGRDATPLLPPSLPLEEGRKRLSDHADVPIEEIEPYIRASIAADEEQPRQAVRQRRWRARVAGFMLMTGFAVFAGWPWHQAGRGSARAQEGASRLARQEKARAETDFAIAKHIMDSLILDTAQGLQNASGMRSKTVRRILGAGERTITDLAERAHDDLALQHSRSVMLNNVGDVYQRTGGLTHALQAYEGGQGIRRRLAASDPGHTLWQRDVSVSLNKIGDVRWDTGDRAGALQAYEESLAIARRLAATDPGNTEWQRDVLVSFWKVAIASDKARRRTVLQEALQNIADLEARNALTSDQESWRQRIEAELARYTNETR